MTETLSPSDRLQFGGPPPPSPRRGSFLVGVAPVIGVVVFLGRLAARGDASSTSSDSSCPLRGTSCVHIAGDPAFYVRNGRTTLWEAFLGFTIADSSCWR